MSTVGCCPSSRVPKLEKSTTGRGEFITLKKSNAKVYVSGPADSKRMVVCHADIYGYTTGRHTAICDFFAENGYLVVMPDYFNGDVLSGEFAPFLKKHLLPQVQPILDETYDTFVTDSVESIFMIGFCYGCWTIFNESKRNILKTKFKFAACFHPSVQIEGLTGKNTEELCKAVKHPMLLVPTNNDVEYVQKGSFLEKDPYNMVIMDHTHQEHGFMTQGDFNKNEKMENDVSNLLKESLKLFSKY